MRLKSGYKQTEVGVIPDEWEVSSMGRLVAEFRGGASLRPSDFTSTGVKVLPKGGVGRTGWLHIEDNELKYCSPEYAAAHQRNQVDHTFTIVVLRDLVPSGPSIGLMVQIKDEDIYVLAQGVYGFKVTKAAVPGYLVQLSNTNWYRKLANSIMVGSTQVHITNTAFKRVRIPLPSIDEQHAIATTLSDMDALIDSLDKLIAKKRLIKQGAMQELLTGKTRLSGFSGEWGVKSVGEVFNVSAGGDFEPTLSSAIRDESFPYPIYSNAISDKGLYGYCIYAEHQAGSITVTARGTLGIANFRDHPYTAIGRVLILQPNQPVEGRFFSEFINHCIDFAVESTGVPQLTAPQISKYKILTPSIIEQQAIAAVLSDMDAEIAALEQRREKTHLIKQGMMQELLSGRKRLV